MVEDGEVHIVDEFTGRKMEGRRWSEGLHQAVEAKEGLQIQDENITVATVTIQNYFRMYEKLSGMTGTALTEANEFHEIYGLEVVPIPTNRPMVRLDQNDQIYKTKEEKFAAAIDDIVERHATGQPVLVGTISVEVSEHLSRLLERRGRQARGAERQEPRARGRDHPGRRPAGRGHDRDQHGRPRRRHQARRRRADQGGLYVLGTERHESRRIDNQLRGRSGRQGDPGETRFYLSAQDEVVRLFAGDRMYKILDRLGPTDGEPIEAKMLTNQIERAQKKVEEFHFVNRKNVVKYDDVLNDQRSQVYARRRQILEGEDLRESVIGWIEDVIEAVVDAHSAGEFAEEWDWDGMRAALHCGLPGAGRHRRARSQADLARGSARRRVRRRRRLLRGARADVGEMDEKLPRNIERWIVLQVMDTRWREHLDNMEYFRQGVGLQGYAQKDPLVGVQVRGHAHVRGDERADQAGGGARSDARRGRARPDAPVRAAARARPRVPARRRRRPLEALAAGYEAPTPTSEAVRAADRGAAPARSREDGRPQRSLLVRVRARNTSGAMALDVGDEPRSLEDLRAAVEELRAQLHWVRDYL